MNVVLQDNRQVTDDGSLSVYCGKWGIPYVNVEAQHEHLEQQLQMLKVLLRIIADPQYGLLNAPLVNLASLNAGFVIEARYATTDNITGQRLYPANELYLARDAADRLVRVQRKLQAEGLGLKVFDAYRPLSVQRKLWEKMPDERYVANPAKGSRHNRGYAVDVTLVGRDGQELPLPTAFDEFSEKAHLDYQDLPAEVLRNRARLQEAMKSEQFEPLATEWWHFDAPGWHRQPVMDVNPWGQP
jgi:D-alanyl-D-alanine dipeptidase